MKNGYVKKARTKAQVWIKENLSDYLDVVSIGLPEYDDRYNIWRVPLNLENGKDRLVGEIKYDKSIEKMVGRTKTKIITERIEKYRNEKPKKAKQKSGLFYPAPIPNKVILGDAIKVLEDFPPDTAQLMITSPPYFNAKPEYSEYVDYQEYLDFLRKAIARVHNVLSDGRFLVMNVSPVLIRRTSRKTSSKRIPIPFDVHKVIESVGFEFMDDIIWVKPEGAGWNLGRGRRFRADRQPLQYKPVPVTEHVLVYRKKTDKLIDWNIRRHYDQKLVKRSKIRGKYEVTNVWHIHPAFSKHHPAVFPRELVRRIIRYYSFKDDLVLDPFAGSGTVGHVAYEMGRRFLLIDNDPKYFKLMKRALNERIKNKIRIDYEIHETFKGV